MPRICSCYEYMQRHPTVHETAARSVTRYVRRGLPAVVHGHTRTLRNGTERSVKKAWRGHTRLASFPIRIAASTESARTSRARVGDEYEDAWCSRPLLPLRPKRSARWSWHYFAMSRCQESLKPITLPTAPLSRIRPMPNKVARCTRRVDNRSSITSVAISESWIATMTTGGAIAPGGN